MRLVYFGSGAFGLPTLAHLAHAHDVALVVTQPDKPAGRGGKLAPTPIAQWAAENLSAVPILKPVKVSDPSIIAHIRAVSADAWVVIAFGQKLPDSLLADRFALNLHASLLPRWRGAAPINAAILSGDTHTGNSIITLASRMDAGLVLGQSHREIGPQQTAGELHDLLAADGPALVQRVLDEHAAGTLKPVTQDESLVTIATKLSRSDDQIDFAQRADFVRRQIHALTPWPGISCMLTPTNLPIKLLRASVFATPTNEEPGTIINASEGLIACGGRTTVQLLEIQPPGKRPMSWQSFVNGAGRAVTSGSRIIAAREHSA